MNCHTKKICKIIEKVKVHAGLIINNTSTVRVLISAAITGPFVDICKPLLYGLLTTRGGPWVNPWHREGRGSIHDTGRAMGQSMAKRAMDQHMTQGGPWVHP